MQSRGRKSVVHFQSSHQDQHLREGGAQPWMGQYTNVAGTSSSAAYQISFEITQPRSRSWQVWQDEVRRDRNHDSNRALDDEQPPVIIPVSILLHPSLAKKDNARQDSPPRCNPPLPIKTMRNASSNQARDASRDQTARIQQGRPQCQLLPRIPAAQEEQAAREVRCFDEAQHKPNGN